MFLGNSFLGSARNGVRSAAYYTIAPPQRRKPHDARTTEAGRVAHESAAVTRSMTRRQVDGPALLQAVRAAVANLERFAAEVDALNVFPVPDGDTGSNMLATMRAALAEAERVPAASQDLESVAGALSRGALEGARGNSGVILSQIIRGMAGGASDRRAASGVDLARGLRRGAEAAYDSVLTPVEGTILTVVRDAAEAAERAADESTHVERVLATAVEAASDSVARTPSLLPVLADAGVVDSGGQGLFRILEGTLQVDGVPLGMVEDVETSREAPTPIPSPVSVPTHGGHGFGYETEYLLSADGDALDLAELRAELTAIGESVVVAGDASAARVHIHGRRPDLAIGIGLRAGHLSAIEVKDLDAQAAHHAEAEGAAASLGGAQPATQRLSLVAVAPAPGLAEAFRAFGANVVEPASSGRPSVGEIAGVVNATGARSVIILPNDRDAHLAAGQSSAMTPQVDAVVLPTRNAAEGIAAALAFDAGATLEVNTERMEAEAMSVASFTVSIAARDAIVDGVAVQRGQAIALDADERLLACEDELLGAAMSALSRTDAAELVTIYHGAAVAPAVARELADRVVASEPDIEVEIVNGGQRHDRLLVAVE